MSNNLFVASLAYDLTDLQLEEHFQKIGKVLTAKVIVDRATGVGKGFGFVEMASVDDAKKAIQELNNSTLGGRTIIVKESKPRD